ncbi:MAG TPA: UvrD-helicase domain-containing protein, partial [Candidatus Paceibacterota bacterium]
MNYLDSLNEEQKKAVLEVNGPVLIVAGAGAGKTKTLTHRVLHLIHSGINPENILAITFTNKAAREMRERVMDLLRNDHFYGKVPFVSTFHSFGVQVIKENCEILGLPRHFNIFDTADSKKILKVVMARMSIDPKEHLDTVRHIISKEKGRGITVSQYLERSAFDTTSEITRKIWPLYEEKLKTEKALDFDDLLLKTLGLLKKNEDI